MVRLVPGWTRKRRVPLVPPLPLIAVPWPVASSVVVVEITIVFVRVIVPSQVSVIRPPVPIASSRAAAVQFVIVPPAQAAHNGQLSAIEARSENRNLGTRGN